jgi:hypothetical protein
MLQIITKLLIPIIHARKANLAGNKGMGISNSSNGHLLKCKIYLDKRGREMKMFYWDGK